jgi:dipeptidyl aminopeptidase/acylaminoacyl peptidase
VDNLTWSSDGQTLLFTASASGAPLSSTAVYAVSAAGGEPRRIALGEDSCAGGLQQPPGAPDAIVLVGQGLGSRLCWLAPATGALREVYRADPANDQFGLGAWCVQVRPTGGLAGAPTGGREAAGSPGPAVLAAVRSAGDQPWEVWAGTLPAAGLQARSHRKPSTPLRRLTRHQDSLAAVEFAAQEPFTWTAPDGWELDGLLIRPPAQRHARSARPDTPLPTVVLVHGGPYGRWGHGFQLGPLNWGQWLALAGYAVLLPNPRGGFGHGERFAAAVQGDVGGADYRDVLAAVDTAVERGIADPQRLAIGGWSQGGFMAAWAVTQTQRFRAAIVGAGVSDWGMMTLTSDLPGFERALGGSVPWDGVGPHRHSVLSPIAFTRAVTTPVLILHGERDTRVPVSQAIGFHRALREAGTPTELVIYPREPHGIGERAHQVDLLRRVRAWYDRWLRP